MKISPSEIIVPQLDEMISKFEDLQRTSKYDDFSDVDLTIASEFINGSLSAIQRATGVDSEFSSQIKFVLEKYPPRHINLSIPHFGGTLKAVRHAVASGYLISVQETIHANLFADFLEMAEHLLADGFKDPAAVLIGGVLEEHLRKLCDRNAIDTERVNSKGNIRPKNAETLNTELASNGIYSKLDQKNVTAWLDLRNKAAHGRYTEYSSQQVELFLQSIRDFLTRNPA